MTYFTQDVLNAVFRWEIRVLPPEYNVITAVMTLCVITCSVVPCS